MSNHNLAHRGRDHHHDKKGSWAVKIHLCKSHPDAVLLISAHIMAKYTKLI